jgi:hypothetical protein
MVRWFDPVQLAGTALHVVVSSFFGAYSDKREIQAAVAPGASPKHDYAVGDELWIDYVADLGDGFDSTYTLAALLARPTLTFPAADGPLETPRGRILVMGGDEVYPIATRLEYENRMLGPYKAALPFVPDEADVPHLFAIPGNHDWYDGLTSFIRFFCQGHWVGGWKTQQERSYFALKLPHNWWLWATDIQFDAYIDDPQLSFFRAAQKELAEGDEVILITGKPSWTKGPEHDPSYENLRYFEEEMLKGTGARLALVLSGDLHHYARYENSAGDRQRITSGGGGAYLYPTHHQREHLLLQEPVGTVDYTLQACYPPKADSKRIRWGTIWRLPVRNWRLLRLLGGLYFLVALLLQAPVRRAAAGAGGVDIGDVPDLWWHLVTSRWFIYGAMILVPLFVLYAAGKSMVERVPLGIFHTAMHLLVLTWLVPLSACLLDAIGIWERSPIAIALVVSVLASLVGGSLIGLYLALCDLLFGRALDRHANETFSSQSIEDWKNFLRLHIDREGNLTIYPVGVRRVVRKKEMRFNPDGAPGEPYYLLPDDFAPSLIEPPIRV